MKKWLFCLIIIFCHCLITSCQDNFNEMNDTEQRHVVFIFHTDSLFSNVLCNSGTYCFPQVNSLPSDSRLRITAYCYDGKGDLMQSKQLFVLLHEEQSIKFRHLIKDKIYRFVFLVDVVKYYTDNDYYETWYQLGVQKWNTFYIYGDNRHEDAIYDYIGLSSFEVQADNHTVEVSFEPITYNGFCIFTNLQGIDYLSGYVQPCTSFKLSSMEWKELNGLPYVINYPNPKEDIIKPISLCNADSLLIMYLVPHYISGNDTTCLKVSNPNRQPFVVTIDCKNMKINSLILY